MFSMAHILAHSPHVPQAARHALQEAVTASPDTRTELLESAARILYRESGLECRDVRELVGLPH